MTDTFLIGSARVDVTPPLTIPYLGFTPRHDFFQGVHDPLYAKAVVVGDGDDRVALVAVDAIGFRKDLMGKGRDFTAEVREHIQKRTGIAPDHVMLSATHAHSTPETIGIRRLLDHPGAAEWLDVFADQLASAVAMANRNLKPARLKRSTSPLHGLSWSRRILGKDGKLYWWGNRPPDDEIADWGANDHDVDVLCFEPLREGEAPAEPGGFVPTCRDSVVLVNFACHPTTVQVQPLVSADFPGRATALVENSDVGCGLCLFLQGACGDIRAIRTVDFDDVRRQGQLLAGEITKQLALLNVPEYPEVTPCVGAVSETITVPSRPLPPLEPLEEAYLKAKQAYEQAMTDEERRRTGGELLRTAEPYERTRRGDAPVEAEIQVLRIGDVALVGIPGEPFCEMGLDLKKNAAAPRSLCLGYTNDYLGYIAPPSAWEIGGYEVSLGTWSIVGPEAMGMMLETAKRLVKRLWSEVYWGDRL